MSDYSSHAALDPAGRARKAEKILSLLDVGPSADMHGSLLEIGTGSGAIAAWFGSRFPALRVVAVDVADQRVVFDGFDFQTYDGATLPYDSQTFDYVISNHVIEHVGQRQEQRRHLAEIARVLRPYGQAYLATPSRWQFIEPHFRLPALSWLPRAWRDAYVRRAGRGERYDCDPLGHTELEALLARAGFVSRNVNAEALKAACRTEGVSVLLRLAGKIPVAWLRPWYRFSPTMVYLLAHGTPAASNP